jgi:hypothetical protein
MKREYKQQHRLSLFFFLVFVVEGGTQGNSSELKTSKQSMDDRTRQGGSEAEAAKGSIKCENIAATYE